MPYASAANSEAAASAGAIAHAHAALLADKSLQFDRVAFTRPQAPDWLQWLLDLLRAAQPAMKWVFWIGLAILAALILFFVVREVARLRKGPARPTPLVLENNDDWRPDAGAARDLLEAADRLAAQGLYAEAAHLILLRSVEDIERRRPRSLHASLTTREISALRSLPEAARPAFGKIGRIVERSLFGGRAVNADDFAECRQAYQAFALPGGWAA